MSGASIDYIFSEEGLLGGLPNYRKRSGQIAMAKAVQAALTDNENLVAEAGTGTGKTFAYLIPVLMSGGRAIVATYSLTLQDQLSTKDTVKLAELLKNPCSVVKLKGVGNYVCMEHLIHFVRKCQKTHKHKEGKEDQLGKSDLEGWENIDEGDKENKTVASAKADKKDRPVVVTISKHELEILEDYIDCVKSGSGDVTEVDADDEDFDEEVFEVTGAKDAGELSNLRRYLKKKDMRDNAIRDICSNAVIRLDYEKCLGARDCPYAKLCAYQKARDQARRAKLVILNHSLFCRLSEAARTQELMNNSKREKNGTEGEANDKGAESILAGFNLCIVDEAHHFPQVVKDSFSRQLTTISFDRVKQQIQNITEKLLDLGGDGKLDEAREALLEKSFALGECCNDFVAALKRAVPYKADSRFTKNASREESAEQLMDGQLVYGLGAEAYALASTFHEVYTGFNAIYQNYAGLRTEQYDSMWQNYQDRCKEEASKIILDQKKGKERSRKELVETREEFVAEFRSLKGELDYLADTIVEVGSFIEDYFCEPLFGRAFDSSINYRSAAWASGGQNSSHALTFDLRICPYSANADFHRRIMDVGCFHDTSFVFTSATLGTGGTSKNIDIDQASRETKNAREQLSVFCNELALPVDKTKCLLANSPFDYPANGMLYVPELLKKHDDPRTITATELVQSIAHVLRNVQGGILVLCTAMRTVNVLQKALSSQVETAKRKILWQEEGCNRIDLINKFRENGRAILIGTKSFWEGVDIPGKALSAVVIDKLPFPAPGVSIRAERDHAQNVLGLSPFQAVDLPRAIIDLKQGVGRLIRCESDSGVVIICDPRLLKSKQKSYREQIMNALPNFSYTESEIEVLQFLEKKSQS